MVEGAATRLEGPLLFRRTLDVGQQDAVEVRGGDGRVRLGRVAAIVTKFLTIEVLDFYLGPHARWHDSAFLRRAAVVRRRPVDPGQRHFKGIGQVIDGGPPVVTRIPAHRRPADEPAARQCPAIFIGMGITTLDLMNSLVRGQDSAHCSPAADCRTIGSRWTSRRTRDCRTRKVVNSRSCSPASVFPTTARITFGAGLSRAVRSSAPPCS